MKRLLCYTRINSNIINVNKCQRRHFIDPSKKYPTINDLFSQSLTCSKVEYKGKKIFLIGDKGSDEYSLSRIEYVIEKLQPSVVMLEAENPFLGRDDNQFNQKDASWRKPNPSGTLILDSYQNFHCDQYPNLGTYLNAYTPDNKQSHILQLRQICEANNTQIHFCGDDLADLLLKKSKMGQLEELTVQFREQFLREAKRAKEKRDKNQAAAHGRQQQSFFGAMEGLDEKEQREHIELTKLVVDDLSNLAKMFENDILMNSEQFRDMMRQCNNLRTIDDYELMSEKSLVRNGLLNETIRSLEFDYELNAEDFWVALRLLTVNRDRLLLRILIEQSEEMLRNDQQGTILAVFNLLHIYGIETLWRSNKFWNDEAVTREYVKQMSDRNRIKEELEDKEAPFFGKNDPARDTDINEATRF
eukprot:524319_1